MRLVGQVLAVAVFAAAPAEVGAQRRLELASLPQPGGVLRLRLEAPVGAAGNAWTLLGSLPTSRVAAVAGVRGALRLDPVTLVAGASGVVGAAGTSIELALPASPALLGAQIDLQTVDVDPGDRSLTLSDNDVVATVLGTIGRHLWTRRTASETGLWFVGVDDRRLGGRDVRSAVGRDERVPARYVPASCVTFGARGWTQGYGDAGLVGSKADPFVLVGDRVAVDGRSELRLVVLPNGRRFTVVRDAVEQEEWVALSFDASTGSYQELSGTRRRRLPINATLSFGPPYDTFWGFSADGELAVGAMTYSFPNRPRTTDPFDQLVIVRTDGTPWPGTTSATLDAFASGDVQLARETLVVANERAFVWSLDGRLFTAALRQPTALVEVSLPLTGTGKANVWAVDRSFRLSADRRTLVLPIIGSVRATRDNDVVGLTNIDANGFVVRNITAFPTSTDLELDFGASRRGFDFVADLAPDGGTLALLAGAGQAGAPHRLFLVPTDGRSAGSLVPLPLPPAAVHVTTPHVFPDGSVAFCAGADAWSLDVYRWQPTTGSVTRLTTTADMSVAFSLALDVPAPAQRLLLARRRRVGTRTITNLVQIESTGPVVGLTGTEFGGLGTVPDLELPVEPSECGFRVEPGFRQLLYFAARPARTGATTFDENVYALPLTVGGGPAIPLTQNLGSGPLEERIDVQELDVVRATGEPVFVERLATGRYAPLLGPSRVVVLRTTGARVVLNPNARANEVMRGSLRVGSTTGFVVWTESDDPLGATRAVVHLAAADGSMAGWPLLLSGEPDPTGRLRAFSPVVSSGF